MGLNLNLSPELMLHTFFLHLRLEQHLQCHNCLEFLHSRKIDISKFSLSKWPTNVKVINRNFPEIKTNKSSFKYSGQRQHIRNIELATYFEAELEDEPMHSLAGPKNNTTIKT